MARVMRDLRSEFALWIVVAVVLLAGIGVGAVMGLFSRKPGEGLFNRAPQPSKCDAAAVTIPAEGVRATVKQNGKAWLPGGRYELHLDDITGRQVLISVTDADGHVVLGPMSVKRNSGFAVPLGERPAFVVRVVRLENMLAGGDFGEFLVLPPGGVREGTPEGATK